MRRILVALLVVMAVVLAAVLAGVIYGGGKGTITPTPTPTPTPTADGNFVPCQEVRREKCLELTAQELISLTKDNQGKYIGTWFRVSGIVADIHIDYRWYIHLGPAQEGFYVIAPMGVSDIIEIVSSYPDYPKTEMTIEGRYEGFYQIGEHTGPVLEYVKRIK